MAEKHTQRSKNVDTQKDKQDRPEPSLGPVEGDLETIEEDLRQKEQPRKQRAGGGKAQ
jgi:hypothetical protein